MSRVRINTVKLYFQIIETQKYALFTGIQLHICMEYGS